MELEKAQTQDSTTHLTGFDGTARSQPRCHEGSDTAEASSHAATDPRRRGNVLLDNTLLLQLRQARLMSRQDLANDCWRRNIPLSHTTIKRAEAGRPVRFRIARELARCFEIPVTRILRNTELEVATEAIKEETI